MEVVHLLKEIDLLEGVDDATLHRLAGAGHVVRFERGDYVVRQGEFGDTFFVLLDGRATVQVVGEDGRHADVDELRAGQYFGELAIAGHGERFASVKCVAPSQLLELKTADFELALKKYKNVRGRVENVFVRQSLRTFIRQSRYFRDLPEDARRDLVESSSLAQYSKGETIAEEGEPAQKLFIVRSGFVRISRKVHNASDEILAYLGPEDFFGDQEISNGSAFQTSAVALEPVECMTVPRSVVWKIYADHPQVFSAFRRYQLTRTKEQEGVLGSSTAMGFVRDMLEAGLGQARSALIINMDACVRCGNCVQACDDLHGYSRIARRGKKMTRRVEMESKKHENLYFPTSCLQCAAPECMVGCPTGAIARDTGGEVYIKDTCIGCGTCARNCDFGNISMAKARIEEPSLLELLGGGSSGDSDAARARADTLPPGKMKSDLIAVKCDVCFEREFAACVYNCPTTAVLRIDPRSYFEELTRIAPKLAIAGAPAAAKTTTKRPNRWIDPVLQLAAVFTSIFGAWALWLAVKPTSWSGAGLTAGITGFAMIIALALIGIRKRLRTQKLGSLATWARVHAVLGGLVYGVVLFHSGFQATSLLTAALLSTLTLATVVGIGGQLASAIIPRILAKSEDEALLPEDVVPKMRELETSNAQYLAGVGALSKNKVDAQVKRLAESGFAMLSQGISPRALVALLEKKAKKLPALMEADHAIALRVAENLSIIRLHAWRRALEIFMTSWVPLHLVASATAMMLLMGHLMTVLLW